MRALAIATLWAALGWLISPEISKLNPLRTISCSSTDGLIPATSSSVSSPLTNISTGAEVL